MGFVLMNVAGATMGFLGGLLVGWVITLISLVVGGAVGGAVGSSIMFFPVRQLSLWLCPPDIGHRTSDFRLSTSDSWLL